MNHKVPGDLRYTNEHEWARRGSADVEVGITAFAAEQLGDITLVNLDVKVGDTVTVGKPFGTIESVKTLSDLNPPIGGKVARINDALMQKPELVNEDCYGKGWMIAIAPSDPKAIEGLLDAKTYSEHLKTAAH